MADFIGKERDYERPVEVRWADQGDGTYAKVVIDRNQVWDTNTLAWVKMQQPVIKTDTLTVSADVSDRAGRLLGVVASITATVAANITQIAGVAISLGQKVATASLPVVLASDQTSIPVAATLAAETTKVIGTVNVAAGQSIQANAGTNLNTSLLALDSTVSTVAKDATIVSSNTKLDTLHTDLGLVAKDSTVAKDASVTAIDTDLRAILGVVNSDGSSANYGTALYWLRAQKASMDALAKTQAQIIAALTPPVKKPQTTTLLHR
jgi:hypothetical protein